MPLCVRPVSAHRFPTYASVLVASWLFAAFPGLTRAQSEGEAGAAREPTNVDKAEAPPQAESAPSPVTSPLPSAALPPGDAHPQSPTTVEATHALPPSQPRERFTFGATLSTTAESEPGSTSVLTAPLLEAAYAVHSQVLLDLAWGFGWLVDNQGLGESTLRAGNPQLSGYFRFEAGPWRFRSGLGVTAPLAHVPLGYDGRLYTFVYNQTAAMWGMWNLWLWSPERMAVPFIGKADYALPGGHVLTVDAAVAPSVGVRGGSHGTEILGQFAFEARFIALDGLAFCPRWQTVILPSTSFDRWQSAAGLAATLDTRAGRFFARFLVNLDQPLGIFGGLGRWGFHLGKEIDL